jgi:caspase domain-containing protein
MANKAIVIGVQGYPELPPELQGPKNDAEKFFEWVTTKGGVNPDPAAGDAKLILDDQPRAQKALDARPTAEAIKHEFDKLEVEAEKSPGGRVGDRLYLYLSGHGFGQRLEDAALLMPNATQSRTRNHIPGRAWADHFYSKGLFTEVLMFMDCCRERYAPATLNGPGTDSDAAPPQGSRRFYGFAANHGLLTVERMIGDRMGGVFTAALLAGLNGGASEEDGRITGQSLMAYLYENMRGFLSPEDLEGNEVAQEPHLFCDPMPKDFLIATVPPLLYDVTIPLPPGSAGKSRQLREGGNFAQIAAAPPDGTESWKLQLHRGAYLLVVNGRTQIVTVKGRGVIDVQDVQDT